MKIFEGSDYDIGDALRRVGVADADIAAITRNARHLDAYIEELLERKEGEDDC